jgi:putative spermidine/putrescine transport system ATP-binding protein
MSDRIAVFNNGRIEQMGTPADVYENPRTAFVAGFVGTSNLLEGEVARAITGSGDRFTVRPEKIRLAEPDDQPGAGEYAVAGVVRAVVYLGVNTRYVVDVDGGGELVVVRQNDTTSSMDALAQRGRRVKLVWNRQHNRTIPSASTTRAEQEVPA